MKQNLNRAKDRKSTTKNHTKVLQRDTQQQDNNTTYKRHKMTNISLENIGLFRKPTTSVLNCPL